MKIFHAVTALLFAHLLELFAGNLNAVIPFSACVLNRITAKMSYGVVFLCGFLSGLLFDLIYWRTFPAAALATGVTVLLVRFLSDRAGIKSRFSDALFKGALTGLLLPILNCLLLSPSTGSFFPRAMYLVTSLAGAVIGQLLISAPRSGNNEPSEQNLPKEKGSGKPSVRSGRRGSASGSRSNGKKR